MFETKTHYLASMNQLTEIASKLQPRVKTGNRCFAINEDSLRWARHDRPDSPSRWGGHPRCANRTLLGAVVAPATGAVTAQPYPVCNAEGVCFSRQCDLAAPSTVSMCEYQNNI